jgi:hypothetical protein
MPTNSATALLVHLKFSLRKAQYGPYQLRPPYRELNSRRGRDTFQLALPFDPLSSNRLFRVTLVWGMVSLAHMEQEIGRTS